MIDTLTFLEQLRQFNGPEYIENLNFKAKSKKYKIYPVKYSIQRTTFEDHETFIVFYREKYNLLKADIF